ncbi:acetyl-CoA carboxylase biotin carboxyl carrier protein subunit [Chloroflexota bacterium]
MYVKLGCFLHYVGNTLVYFSNFGFSHFVSFPAGGNGAKKINIYKGSCKVAKETVEIPITGKIVKVEVKQGDTVAEGDILCVLESMKMENPIMAPVGGTVVEIGVSVDELVKPGQLVAVIEN